MSNRLRCTEELSQRATFLFSQGCDTQSIAQAMKIPEARVSRLIWLARCRRLKLPATYISDGHLKQVAL